MLSHCLMSRWSMQTWRRISIAALAGIALIVSLAVVIAAVPDLGVASAVMHHLATAHHIVAVNTPLTNCPGSTLPCK